MALTCTATTVLAEFPSSGGGTMGIYRTAYTVDGAAATELLSTQVSGGANGIPDNMTIIAWINGATAVGTDYDGGGAAPDNLALPILDQALQTLRFMNGNGAMALVANVAASVAAEAIIIAVSA